MPLQRTPPLLLLVIGCGSAGVGCDEDRVQQASSAIANGVLDAADPGVIALGYTDTAGPFCTGELIAPRVVLTAAHCVDSQFPGSFRVYVGPGPGNFLEHAEVLDVRTHPAWNRVAAQNDVAMLLLAVELDAPTIQIFQRQLVSSDVGTSVRIVGYGADPADIDGATSGAKQSGTASIQSLSATTLTVATNPSLPCAGDSGGPAFLSLDGSEIVAGIASYGNQACADVAVYTRLDAFRDDFIEPYIQWSREGSVDSGGACAADYQCVGGTCIEADDDPAVHYCSEACSADTECPPGMECALDRKLCAFPHPTPRALGARCSGPDDCESGLCSSSVIGGAGTCTRICRPNGHPCAADLACVAVDVPDLEYLCLPAHEGCNAFTRDHRGGCVLLRIDMLAVLSAVAATLRRRRPTR